MKKKLRKKIFYKKQQGFTFVELMISISVFLVLLTITLSSLSMVGTLSKEVRNLQRVMENVDFIMDDIQRSARFGTEYSCLGEEDEFSNLFDSNDCEEGVYLSFTPFDKNPWERVIYRFNETEKRIEKSIDSGANFFPFSDSTVDIEKASFTVRGSGFRDKKHATIFYIIKASVPGGKGEPIIFSLQGTVSKRSTDF